METWVGFEPTTGDFSHYGVANRNLQPLGHQAIIIEFFYILDIKKPPESEVILIYIFEDNYTNSQQNVEQQQNNLVSVVIFSPFLLLIL